MFYKSDFFSKGSLIYSHFKKYIDAREFNEEK